MSAAPSAREAILRSIREGLAKSAEIEARHPLHHAAPPKPRPLAQPAVALAPPPAPLAAFRARMEAVGGRVVEASDEGEAAAAVASVLAELGVRTLAVTDAPLALDVAARLRDSSGLEVLANATSEQLFDCDAGLTEAQWGIVETGTLVLASARERNRLASLVPPVHVALLRASNLRDTIGDALASAREPDGSVPSHVITFITGPSRTSDIELTLAIGVHGPQVLLVVIIP
jgi:L-lactate dehydrogenase complex protein LldG